MSIDLTLLVMLRAEGKRPEKACYKRKQSVVCMLGRWNTFDRIEHDVWCNVRQTWIDHLRFEDLRMLQLMLLG